MILEYNLDKYNGNYNFFKNVKEGDTLTLKCNILEKGQPKDLTGYIADLRWINANNTFVNIEGSKVTIVGNVVTIQCDNNCTKAPGTCKFELHLHSSLEEDYSFTQKVDVFESVFKGQAASKNVSTILDDLNEANINAEKFVKDYGDLYGINSRIGNIDYDLVNTKTKINKIFANSSDSIECRFSDDNHVIQHNDLAFQTINFDEITNKNSEYFSFINNEIQILKEGLYQINLNLTFKNSLNQSHRQINIVKNGSTYIGSYAIREDKEQWSTCAHSFIYKFKANDLIKIDTIVRTSDAILPKRVQCNFLKIDLIIPKINIDIREKKTIYHILGTGQSLAVGAEGSPCLTNYTPYNFLDNCFMFNGGARPLDGCYVSGPENIDLDEKAISSFVSLKEQDRILYLDDGSGGTREAYQGETICSAMGYVFNKMTGEKVLVSEHGIGGQPYINLKKGTLPYNNMMKAVVRGKMIAENLGYNYKVLALAVVHGEADSSTQGTTYSQYISYLNEWQSNVDTDVKAITGQTEDVKLYISQTASSSSYKLSSSPIPNAEFKASLDNNNIRLVCPQYWFDYASVHMVAKGYRRLGEYFGVKIARDFLGYSESVVYPIKSLIVDNTITITFNVNGKLVFDTINVKQRSDGNYGFKTYNDSENATITNVEIVGDNKVKLTFDKNPSTATYVSYAYIPLADEMGYIGYTKGIRGNLRDNGGSNSIFDNTALPNWCSIFAIPGNYN